MKKHKKLMRETRVVARAMEPLANGEAAMGGTAVVAVNVREREQSLQVTGVPATVGHIAAGDRLLTMAAGHVVTCRGRMVLIDGDQVVECGSDIVGAYRIGEMMVIVARNELIYLMQGDHGWNVMDPADAVPQLTFTADVTTSSAEIPAYSFAAPYQQWRAPLSDEDENALAGLLRHAWDALHSDAAAAGSHSAPVLVRWAVRLRDGSYLWVSDPVRVGDETLSNADRIAATVDSSNSGFTGTQATLMTQRHYRIGIGVTQGIADAWLPLVAGIDVLATDEASLLTASRSLDYRCLTRTTGGREYVLEMGLSRRSADTISRQLAASPWHVIATAPATAAMSGSDFVEPMTATTFTAEQCAALATPFDPGDIVCATAAAGRLFCCTRGGDVVVSAPGNALVEYCRRSVLGVVPLAMSVVTRPLYSSGFGRYAVYVFSDDGIYAIPQSAVGSLGEARLVDRTVIDADVPPVEGGTAVWLVSRHGHLCRLSGSQLTVVHRDMNCSALAWCNAYGELWMLPDSGNPMVLMDSGRMSERTVGVSQLYSDPRHAIAVSPSGDMLDLEQEQTGAMAVSWRSHPVALHPLMGEAIHRVVWHLSSDEASLTLTVDGQRGVMAGDFTMSLVTVNGAVSQPLATPTMARQARSLVLAMTGEARTGTLLLPTLIYTSRIS